ncbi:hypothetical protein KI387_021768 [Taxus chinensis]|uniref:Uncharacterized protein n=1 Tax=Taxus chinensis TaxID=29808 RepID=A0AA38LCQ4_TAXCH|nr:hypothetical protein KI387_021768 [Taxus chinensis]
MEENSGCGKNQPQKHRMTTRAAMAFLKRINDEKNEEEKAFVDQTKENSDFEEEVDTDLNIDDNSDQNDEDYEVEEEDEDDDWLPSPSHKASNDCKHQRSYLQQCKVIKEIGKRDRFKCMVFPCCNYEMKGIKWHLKDINYHRLHDHNGLPPLHRRKPGKRATGKYQRKTKKTVKNMVAKRSVDWHLKNSKYMYKSRLIERYCREEKVQNFSSLSQEAKDLISKLVEEYDSVEKREERKKKTLSTLQYKKDFMKTDCTKSDLSGQKDKDSTDVDGEDPIQKKNANNNAMENKSVEEENTVEACTSSAWVHEPPMQITPISIRTKESEGNDKNEKEKISTEEHKGKNTANPFIEVTDFAKVVEVEPGKPKNEAKDIAACEFTIGEKVFMFLEPDHAKKVGIAKIHATKPGTKCHGRSLERDCSVICVEESYVDDAPLHFPHIGADTVGESKKTYCIWFKDCLKAINQKEYGKETKNEGEQPHKLLVRNVQKLSSTVDSMQSKHKMVRASSDLGKRLKDIKSVASVHTQRTPDEVKGHKRKVREWLEARNSVAVNKQRNNEGDTEMQLSKRIHSSQQQGKILKDIKSAASSHTHLTPDEVKGNKRKVREWLEARNSIAVNKQRRNLKSSQI